MTQRSIFPLALIADDLTGALDAAAAFCADGLSVVVATRPEAYSAALDTGAEVVALSTNSRDGSAQEAQARVARAVAQSAGRRIFKKIDSRLKGYVAAELAPFADVPLLVAPALPAFGRTVENGYLTGFGVAEPIDVRAVLGDLSRAAMVPDCRCADDLDAALAHAPAEAVLVGARDLAFALARAGGLTPQVPAALSGRIGVAVGSTDPITIVQVAALAGTDVSIIPAPSGHSTQIPDARGHIVLQAASGHTSDSIQIGKSLAQSFRPIADLCDTLVLTGGATADVILATLGVELLCLEGEILPGLPVSRGADWRIVTKSGGFGVPNTLLRLLMNGDVD